MCSCLRMSLVLENESKKQKSKEETLSFSESFLSKHTVVRIIHAGGRVEMYQNPIPASKLTQRYPGMCVAEPQVFKRPHESILSGNDMLLPGNKYFIVRSSTVEKLKRRHSKNTARRDPAKLSGDESDDFSVETVTCASDFSISNDNHTANLVAKKAVKEKKRQQFVPPIQRPKLWKEPEWEPGLASIQELSQ
ncbi:hypothetical protein F511_21915 [Dorcoceras hygrometricum]|uniref:Uncharacterized protein n=1 Tax=Dorcoceras hygrometricum TaxID=472368 RepID=A0A2Z7B106_9LAMI|nr:hypothetical protein F511_21915 [Dorcoceras hygrometricum]